MSHTYKGYYNGDYLLSQKDINGNNPGWFFCCSAERGPGKTTYFSRKLIRNYLDHGEQFGLICRDIGELGRVASGVLNSYLNNSVFDKERPRYECFEVIAQKGTYSEIHLAIGEKNEREDNIIGYVLPIRAAEKIKRVSSNFTKIARLFFDEFQPMQERVYIPNEIDLLTIIFDSIARGDGEQSRYVPIICSSNTISLGNPYFTATGLNTKIQSNTRFYKGEGVIFEQVFVEGLSEKHEANPFHVALKKHEKRRKSNIWLNDDNALVEKPQGRGRYICTIEYGGEFIGLLDYSGMWFLSRKTDDKALATYATDPATPSKLPQIKTVPLYKELRDRYYKGRVRVQDAGLQSMLRDLVA